MKKGYLRNVVNEAYAGTDSSNKIQFEVETEQNGGEYYQTVTIMANSLKKVDNTSVMADNVLINFGEFITRVGRKIS
jgi:hypothetical protein